MFFLLITFWADLLFMKMQTNEAPFGYSVTGNSGYHSKTYFYFPFRYQPGFQLGAGWNQLKITYDFLQSSVSSSHSIYSDESVVGYLVPTYINTEALPHLVDSNQRLESSWRAQFHQVDLYLDRKISPYFSVLLGLRGALIEEKIGTDLFRSNTSYDIHLINRHTCRFGGVGPLLGFGFWWPVWEDLCLFGSVKGAFPFQERALDFQLGLTAYSVSIAYRSSFWTHRFSYQGASLGYSLHF